MSSPTRIAVITLALSSALLVAGCEDSLVTAPADGQLTLSASPTGVVLDPGATPPVDSRDVTLTARVIDSRGAGQSGVDVLFSTTGGRLASAGAPGTAPVPVSTDNDGFAIETLTLTTTDPASVDVTASSGVLTQTVTVTKSFVGQNTPPFAVIDDQPPDFQLLNRDVQFDGRFSGDNEGDPITCYQWEIVSTEPISGPEIACASGDPMCEAIQGTSRTLVTRRYSTEQSLTVTLRVSGNPGLTCDATTLEDASEFSPDTAVVFYDIFCDATLPVADAGPPQNASLAGGASVDVVLDGGASFDNESGITAYSWTCGNGDPPIAGARVTCTYDFASTFTASLTVQNGCGQLDTDTTPVTVVP